MSAVAYPSDFLYRPCDRAFVFALREKSGLEKFQAEWILYRIWADFATGGAERREVSSPEEPSGVPIDYTVIEDFCQWQGEAGAMIELAVESGFLNRESTDRGEVLVATGYAEANRNVGGGLQKRGGYARAERAHLRQANSEVMAQLGIYSSVDPPQPVDSQDQRAQANALGIRVWRALGLSDKQKPQQAPDLEAPLFELALTVVKSFTEAQISTMLRDVLASRGKGQSPARVDAVLRSWVAEAAA